MRQQGRLGLVVYVVAIWLLISAAICFGQDSDQEILKLAEPVLEELEKPWPTKCDDFTNNLNDKRLLVTAVFSISTIDSVRGEALLSDLIDQFDDLDVGGKQLYAPVISRVAALSVHDGQIAVDRWRLADSLSAAVDSDGICAENIIAEWRLKVQLEGIVVLTRAGLWENDSEDRTVWLDEAKQLANALGRPELAPVDESEPSDHNPQMIQFIEPVYSENARRARLEGEVVVKAMVNEFGDVSHAEIMKSVHPVLDEAAMAAAKECRFSPGRRGGVPVKAVMAIPYTFKLEENQDR